MRHRLDIETERANRMERITRIVAAYRDGEKLKAIADRFGIAEATVVKWAKKFGHGRNQARRANEAAIAEAYRRGDPVKAITERFGIDRKHVWTVAHRNGLPLRKPRRNDAHTKAPHPEAPRRGLEGRGADRKEHRP